MSGVRIISTHVHRAGGAVVMDPVCLGRSDGHKTGAARVVA